MHTLKRTLNFILDHPLGKRHPLRALCRLAWWQLQYRFSASKFIVKPFIKDVKFLAAKGLTGITGNIYTGLHEFNDMMFLLHFLQPGDVFFDIGANVGSYTLLASGAAKATSIAIEPIESTFTILTKNIRLNNLDSKVRLLNVGAGAKPGKVTFSTNEDTTNHVLVEAENNQNTENVPVITIDSLSEMEHPSLIKIDVEGFETEVLKGMEATLNISSLKAVIIELNGSGERYGFRDKDIHDLLLSKGFNAFSYNPFKRTLIELNSFGRFNTIYCRDLDDVYYRTQNADNFYVMGENI